MGIFGQRSVSNARLFSVFPLTTMTVAAASVPARPIIAVYHYVHRAYNPLGFQGKWTKEEDAALIR